MSISVWIATVVVNGGRPRPFTARDATPPPVSASSSKTPDIRGYARERWLLCLFGGWDRHHRRGRRPHWCRPAASSSTTSHCRSQSASLGRPRRGRARWDLPRCRRRCLVRGCGRTDTVCACGEVGDVLQTIAVDRGCFACMLGGADCRTLFIIATQWLGPEHMFAGEPTGRIMTVEVSVPPRRPPLMHRYPVAFTQDRSRLSISAGL